MENKFAFLYKEYEMCFEQLRFYDNRSSNLLKYLFTLTSSVATAQFAIYKLTQTLDSRFFTSHAFLSFVVFIATLLLFLGMLQNRLYFVYTARQINAIRGFLLATECSEFTENQLYTSTNFSALKPFSIHTFQIIGAAFLCGLYAGSFAYSIQPSLCNITPSWTYSIWTFLVVSVVAVVGAFIYLGQSSKNTADEAIHRIKQNNEDS